MRIPRTALAGNMKKGFGPLYLLFGAEPLLIDESLEHFRVAAQQAGYEERIRLTAEVGFDWSQLHLHSRSASLFAEKRLIEMRMPSGKPGDAGAKTLLAYCASMAEDTTLMLICEAIDKRGQASKWFKAVEAAGVVVECPLIGVAQLPKWIDQRLAKVGLQAEPAAVTRLCTLMEGNLLAAAQEINLLALLHPNTTITESQINQTLADHARFNVFGLVDAGVAGAVDRSVRVLQGLRREQTEPVIILWALAREVRTLSQLAAATEQGGNLPALLQKYGVWRNRSALVKTALTRLNRRQWEDILQKIGRTDRMLKGNRPLQRQNIWEELESILLDMCGCGIG